MDKNDDIIDTRDIIGRIEELGDTEDPEEIEERDMWQAVIDEIGSCAEDGVGLIRDSYFEDYAREFAEDVGAVNPNARWPNNCIDWGRAADELRADYSSVEIDGTTYWYRE